ncbi:MAG: ABC transporter ATP-binding protein, partial [Patescibacteria group bacterium]
MAPKIYEFIDRAVAKGVSPDEAGRMMITQGWPEQLVNQVVNSWKVSNGRQHNVSNFNAWFLKYRRQSIPYIIAISIACFFVALITLLKPWPTKIMVDSVFSKIPAPGPLEQYTGTSQLIMITAILTIAIFALGTVFNMIRDYLLIKYSYLITKAVRQETFRHILNIPANKGSFSKGDYIHRQNNLTNSVADYALSSRVGIIQSAITVTLIVIVMLILNPLLTIIILFLVPIIFVITWLITPRVGAFGKKYTQNTIAISSIVTESIDNAETIQSFDMANRQVDKTAQLWDENFGLMKKSLFTGRGFHFANNLSVISSIAIVMYIGGTSALNGNLTLGELLIFMTYLGYLLGPVQNIANQFTVRRQRKLDAMRVHQTLQDHEGIEASWENRHFPYKDGRISFQNVSYSYGDFKVIDGINLDIEPGQKIGIIGPSGTGKSTLLKLLSLFLEPTGGKIKIDEIDIQSISLKELRGKIAISNQFPQLFNTSLIENVLDGSPGHALSREDLDYLLEITGINELAKHLPDGVNTKAGEGGNNLSGGQKQRVALARALAKQAPILCLDEPTASLDSNSELQIKNALSKVISHKTVILVSPRRALLELVDTILVLEYGKLTD